MLKIVTMLQPFFSARVIKRVICVILLACDVSHDDISKNLNLSHKSIRKYERMLDKNDLKNIISNKSSNRKSELENYKEVILNEISTGKYTTLSDISSMIENITGLKRSRNRIQVFLRKSGVTQF